MDEKYALLPQDVLSRIEPHTSAQADRLFQQSLAFNGSDGLSERIFSLKRIETGGVDPERVTDWLLNCHKDKETRVVLSWQPNTAVATTWGIFASYWDAFCYPASDDLNVWSEASSWVLAYHHEEFMQFGERQGG
nr:hypothetical protein [uncultured Albidiferax sp.]